MHLIFLSEAFFSPAIILINSKCLVGLLLKSNLVARYEVDELFRQQPALVISFLGAPSLGTIPASQDQLLRWPTGRDC